MESPTASDMFLPNMRGNTIAERIDASGDCWEWCGALRSDGYGHKYYKGKYWSVHRLVWTALVGEIPDGMDIDHLCRNRKCCNPDHLEVVTRSTNLLRGARNGYQRKTHCPYGHPYSGENLVVNSRNRRECRECQHRRSKESRLRGKFER